MIRFSGRIRRHMQHTKWVNAQGTGTIWALRIDLFICNNSFVTLEELFSVEWSEMQRLWVEGPNQRKRTQYKHAQNKRGRNTHQFLSHFILLICSDLGTIHSCRREYTGRTAGVKSEKQSSTDHHFRGRCIAWCSHLSEFTRIWQPTALRFSYMRKMRFHGVW